MSQSTRGRSFRRRLSEQPWRRLKEWTGRRTSVVARTYTSALQVGAAAAAAWAAATAALPWDSPIYAPIGAVVAIGTGEDRMADRPLRLAGGMVVAVAIAGLVVGWLGGGVWQMFAITTLTTIVGRFLFEDTLARTYSAFHGAVIAAMGVSGTIPEQLVEASLGAVIGIAIAHVVFPPQVEPAVLGTVKRAGGLARASLQQLGDALRAGDAERLRDSLDSARQIEARLAPDDKRQTFGRQLAILSPARWKERGVVENYIEADQRLSALLLDIASVVRVAQGLTVREPRPRTSLAAAIGELAMALPWLVNTPFEKDGYRHVIAGVERMRDHLEPREDLTQGEATLRAELWELSENFAATARHLASQGLSGQ